MAVEYRSTNRSATQPAPQLGASPSLRALAESLIDDVPKLCDQVLRTIYSAIPPYSSGRPVSKTELRRSAQSNLTSILHRLADLPMSDAEPFDAPKRTGQLRAEQGMPLEYVARAFRVGGRVLWQELVSAARRLPDVNPDLLLDDALLVWEVIDEFSSVLSDAYRHTEFSIERRNARRREAILEALLEGRGDSSSFQQQAAAVLDVTPTDRLLMVATSTGAREEDPVPAWSAKLRGQGLGSIWLSHVDRHIALILLGAAPVERAVAALGELPDTTIGVSPPFTGLAGVADARRFAEIALHTVPGGTPGVACLDERLIEALITGSPEIAQRLVQRHIGGLLTLPPADRDSLVETLTTWLDCGGSIGRSARQLYCHRNTVLNRIHQIEQLTDQDLGSGTARIGCAIALRALPLVNP